MISASSSVDHSLQIQEVINAALILLDETPILTPELKTILVSLGKLNKDAKYSFEPKGNQVFLAGMKPLDRYVFVKNLQDSVLSLFNKPRTVTKEICVLSMYCYILCKEAEKEVERFYGKQ